MQFLPNTFALACRHTFISVFITIINIDILQIIEVLLHDVLLVLYSLDHFLHVADVELYSFSSTVGPEGLGVSLYLEKSQLIFFDWLLEKRSWYFFGFYEYFGWIGLLFSHFDSQFFQRFLVDGPDITEPFSVGIDSRCYSRPFMHFFHIWHFLIIHFQSLYGIFSSKSIADSTGITLDHPVRVCRCIRFSTLLEFAMQLLMVCSNSLELLCHC